MPYTQVFLNSFHNRAFSQIILVIQKKKKKKTNRENDKCSNENN